MIIKSMARKAPTFAQLIAYIGRDVGAAGDRESPIGPNGRDADLAPAALFSRNLYHAGADERVVAGQFLDNYRHLPKRRNGNALYHEVIVLEAQPHLDRVRLNAALIGLAERYCARRAPGQLAWGKIHHDTDHPHIHLMISANEVRSPRRVRLNKAAFAEIQRDLERYKVQAHPELAGGPIYDRPERGRGPGITRGEGEAARRTGKASRKQAVAETLRTAMFGAHGREELVRKLRDAGFELYRRGKTFGVQATRGGQRYRLATLGLQPDFEAALNRQRSTPKPERPAPAKAIPIETPSPQRPVRTEKQASARKSAPTQSKAPPLDPRAVALLQHRADMERLADERLRGFDPDRDEGIER